MVPLRTGMTAAILLTAQAGMASVTVHAERELHTVECVAALEVRSDELAKQVKAGRTELRVPLLATLDAGAAFIGSAYLQGDRDEARWQSRLRVAHDAQKGLADAVLAARQASCAEEGRRLLSEANFVGRAVVSRLVERRMQKVLGD